MTGPIFAHQAAFFSSSTKVWTTLIKMGSARGFAGSAGGAAVASVPSATVVTLAPSSVSSFVDSAAPSAMVSSLAAWGARWSHEPLIYGAARGSFLLEQKLGSLSDGRHGLRNCYAAARRRATGGRGCTFMHAGAPVKFLGCSAVKQLARRNSCGSRGRRDADDDASASDAHTILGAPARARSSSARRVGDRLPGCPLVVHLRRRRPRAPATVRDVGRACAISPHNITSRSPHRRRASRATHVFHPCVRWWSMYST